MKKLVIGLSIMFLVIGLDLGITQSTSLAQAATPDPDQTIALGEALFFDPNLSVNRTQSCASCHTPATGYTGPDSETNQAKAVYEGAILTRFGNRKPPPASYAGDSPVLHFDDSLNLWVGGMFWDGRATGQILGDPLAEQAQGPFLNPLEMAMPDARQVVIRVAQSDYSDLFEEVWGPGSLKFALPKDVDSAYEKIARSIAAYERSAVVSPFNSKFDLFYDRAKTKGLDVSKIRCGTQSGGMDGGMIGGITPEMMCSPDLFPAPEVAENLTPMNHFNFMSDTMRIEAFLKTLSDPLPVNYP